MLELYFTRVFVHRNRARIVGHFSLTELGCRRIADANVTESLRKTFTLR